MLPPDINITAWIDPVIDQRGHRACSPYVELFWLPVLGPSATLLLRRLNLFLDMKPEGYRMQLDELSAALGLGQGTHRHAPLPRAIDRCDRFGLLQRPSPDHLAVRRFVGPLPERHIARLHPSLRDAHAAYHRPDVTSNR
jgi:hypothetical protein